MRSVRGTRSSGCALWKKKKENNEVEEEEEEEEEDEKCGLLCFS